MRVPTRLLLTAFSLLAASPCTAQDPDAVRVEVRYSADNLPSVTVLSKAGDPVIASSARILASDLTISDRVVVRPRKSPADSAEAGWLVRLDRSASGAVRAEVYDVDYATVRGSHEVAVSGLTDAGYRAAIHALSDAVIRDISGAPGVSRTRIAFVRRGGQGNELAIVDWDGQGLVSVPTIGSAPTSPAWSPDGRKLAYATVRDGDGLVVEHDLVGGHDRVSATRDGIAITPTYMRNGLVFAATNGDATDLIAWTAAGERTLVHRAHADLLSPSVSPDGQGVAYVSNEMGDPHIYITPATGGEGRLLVDGVTGGREYDQAPDWGSGGFIAFHAADFQIYIIRPDGSGLRALTRTGRNEDATWAPDGRHVIFARAGEGILVTDVVTGRTRTILRTTASMPAANGGPSH